MPYKKKRPDFYLVGLSALYNILQSSDRNILGSQIVEQFDSLNALHTKIKDIQKSTRHQAEQLAEHTANFNAFLNGYKKISSYQKVSDEIRSLKFLNETEKKRTIELTTFWNNAALSMTDLQRKRYKQENEGRAASLFYRIFSGFGYQEKKKAMDNINKEKAKTHTNLERNNKQISEKENDLENIRQKYIHSLDKERVLFLQKQVTNAKNKYNDILREQHEIEQSYEQSKQKFQKSIQSSMTDKKIQAKVKDKMAEDDFIIVPHPSNPLYPFLNPPHIETWSQAIYNSSHASDITTGAFATGGAFGGDHFTSSDSCSSHSGISDSSSSSSYSYDSSSSDSSSSSCDSGF